MFDVLCPSLIFFFLKKNQIYATRHSSAANKNDFIVFNFIDFYVRGFPIHGDCVTGKFPTFFYW
jgi:hypothetical protein